MISLDFCPVLSDLVNTGVAQDADGVPHNVMGMSTTNNILLIRSLMMHLKPERTIEIGLAGGASALTFAASHRDLGHQPHHQHTAIDPYQRVWHHLGKTLLKRSELSGFTEIIEEPSCLALPDKMRSGQKFQLAYIDGSHAFHEAALDFYYIRHLLDVGGIVLFDDCATPDLRRLMKFIRRHIISMREFDLSPFRESPSLLYKAAKRLGRIQCVAFRKIADPEEDESWQWRT